MKPVSVLQDPSFYRGGGNGRQEFLSKTPTFCVCLLVEKTTTDSVTCIPSQGWYSTVQKSKWVFIDQVEIGICGGEPVALQMLFGLKLPPAPYSVANNGQIRWECLEDSHYLLQVQS